MKGEADNHGWARRWGLPASVVVHALIAALAIFGLPVPLHQPQEEQSISVTLEPPPKPEPPKKAPEEAPKAAKPTPMPPPPAAEPVKPPPPTQEKAAAQPVPTLNPVVKFGEKDAGPRKQLDGSAAEDNPPTQLPVTDETKATTEAKRDPPAEDEPQAAETDGAESTKPSPADGKAAEKTGISVDQLVATTPEAPEKAASAAPAKLSTPKKAQTAKASPGAKLQKARTLFSRSADGGEAATTAMANIPRGVRAGRLCSTELRLQLLNGAAPYFPDLLPYYELKEGTILKVPEAAFRARGEWYNLSFECQINADATKVESFAFRVGKPMSVRELERRGLAPGP